MVIDWPLRKAVGCFGAAPIAEILLEHPNIDLGGVDYRGFSVPVRIYQHYRYALENGKKHWDQSWVEFFPRVLHNTTLEARALIIALGSRNLPSHLVKECIRFLYPYEKCQICGKRFDFDSVLHMHLLLSKKPNAFLQKYWKNRKTATMYPIVEKILKTSGLVKVISFQKHRSNCRKYRTDTIYFAYSFFLYAYFFFVMYLITVRAKTNYYGVAPRQGLSYDMLGTTAGRRKNGIPSIARTKLVNNNLLVIFLRVLNVEKASCRWFMEKSVSGVNYDT